MPRIHGRYLPYILPFVLIPGGILGIIQNWGNAYQVFFMVNVILGTAAFGSMAYFPKLRRGRQIGCLMWASFLSVFQLWLLIPLGICLPERWSLGLNKACGFIIKLFVAFVLLYCLLRFVLFFGFGLLFNEPLM